MRKEINKDKFGDIKCKTSFMLKNELFYVEYTEMYYMGDDTRKTCYIGKFGDKNYLVEK